MNKKSFVLDTNVLLQDPEAIFSFGDNTVIIPIGVIEELDSKKKEMNDLGMNSRHVSRKLDEFRKRGDLRKGVLISEHVPDGGIIRIIYNGNLGTYRKENDVDFHVLHVAEQIKKEEPENECIVVSRDINVRLKANALGLDSDDYVGNKVCESVLLDQGFREVEVDRSVYAILALKSECDIDLVFDDDDTPFPNCYLLIKGPNDDHELLAKVSVCRTKVETLPALPKSMKISSKNKEQAFALNALLDPDIDLVCLVGKAGSGKAQPLDAKVLTPKGYVNMGDIIPGMAVSTPNGSSARVLSVYPQGKLDIYKVTFSDGTSTECCENHLWETQTVLNRNRNKKGSVKSLKEIMTSLTYGDKYNHYIPITSPVNFDKTEELPIDPYLMGLLLGDGCFRHTPSLSTGDSEVLEYVKDSLCKLGCEFIYKGENDYNIISSDKYSRGPCGRRIRCVSIDDPNDTKVYTSTKYAEDDGFIRGCIYRCIKGEYSQHKGYIWSYVDEKDRKSGNRVKDCLMDMFLWGEKSEHKFIPELYLYSTIYNRTELLMGLMDSDGSSSSRKTEYYSSSIDMINGVRFIVESLGGKAKIRSKNPKYVYCGKEKIGLKSYTLCISLPPGIIPFKIKRKIHSFIPKTKYVPYRSIVDVSYIGKKEAQCIYIDSEDHLYMTNNCIVTHNTIIAVSAGVHQVIDRNYFEKMLISRPVMPMGRDIGFLPGDLEDKLDPWMKPIYDSLEVIERLSNSTNNKSQKNKVIDGKKIAEDSGKIFIESLTHIRGRSIHNQFILIDEAQNLSPLEVKTIITRAGEGTKIVLTGDVGQIDNPYVDSKSNGLSVVLEAFRDSGIAAHIILSEGVRSRLSEEAANRL